MQKDERLPLKTDQCIMCGLCVQNCKALGSSAISTVGRGVEKKISTPYGIEAAVCIGCASCSEVCPTGCIKVEDDEDGRKIWNKHFEWARCSECGAIITTREHWQAGSDPEDPQLCPKCRQKHITGVFAEDMGEE